MKNFTEEQIEVVVHGALQKSMNNISKRIAENTKNYCNHFEDTPIKQHSIDLAMMSTAIQISTETIKDALIELLCE